MSTFVGVLEIALPFTFGVSKFVSSQSVSCRDLVGATSYFSTNYGKASGLYKNLLCE